MGYYAPVQIHMHKRFQAKWCLPYINMHQKVPATVQMPGTQTLIVVLLSLWWCCLSFQLPHIKDSIYCYVYGQTVDSDTLISLHPAALHYCDKTTRRKAALLQCLGHMELQ